MTESVSGSGLLSWLYRFRNWALAVALFLLPFQRTYALSSPHPELFDTVYPSFASAYFKVADVAILAALVLFLVTERFRFFSIPRHVRWLVIPTLLLAMLALVSVRQARLPVLTLVLVARLVMLAGLVLMVSRTDPRWVMWPLVATVLANALLGVFQYALRRSVGLGLEVPVTADMLRVPIVAAENTRYVRAYGFTVHPNMLAPYLVVAMTLLLGFIVQRYPANNGLATLGVGLAAMALALTYSRASWVSLLIGGAILVGGCLAQPDLRPRLLALRFPLVVGLLVFGMFFATQSRQVASRFSSSSEGGVSTSRTDRVLLLRDAAALLRERPLTGVGGHNFSVEAERSRTITSNYSHDFLWQPVHNFTALVTTELGLPGGALWLFLTIAPWVYAVATWRRHGLDAMALSWFGASVFLAWNGLLDHFAWSLPEGMGLMWTVWAGLSVALERCRSEGHPPLEEETAAPSPPVPAAKPRRATVTLLPGVVLEVRMLRAVLSAFFATRLVIVFLVGVAALHVPFPDRELPASVFPDNEVLDGLVRWNSFWYESVTHGYSVGDVETGDPGNTAFFPGYPILMRLLTPQSGNAFLIGILVSNLAFLIALAYLYALAQREFDDETASRAVFYLAAAPAAIFCSAVYPEGLLVALGAATFYHAGERQWVRAALAGALAATVHSIGLLMAVVIALEGLHQRGVRFWPSPQSDDPLFVHVRKQLALARGAWRSLLAACGVLLGLVAYAVYLHVAFGDALSFLNVWTFWEPNILHAGVVHLVDYVFPTLNLEPRPLTGPASPAFLLELLITLVFAPIVVAVALKMRPAYGVYAVLTFLAPLFGGPLMSMTRQSLILLPCFVLLARYGRRRLVDRLTLVLFLPLMAYLAVMFSRWYWAG